MRAFNPQLRAELRKDGQPHVLDHEAATFDPKRPLETPLERAIREAVEWADRARKAS